MTSNVAFLLAAAIHLVCWTAAAHAAGDVAGGKDHPLVGRYEGATLSEYDAKAFDEIKLMQKPIDHATTAPLTGPSWLDVEGKITKLVYQMPKGRSSLEVIKNHEAELSKKGFQTVFSCAKEACWTDNTDIPPSLLGWAVWTAGKPSFYLNGPVRYILMKASTSAGFVYTSILVGERSDDVTAYISVVEQQGMETDKIVVPKAAEMEKAIIDSGKIDVYGILFDFDKDTLLPGSKPTMDEIAKLLQSKPQLKLEIVGHTDNKGKDDYNQGLSQRRAARIVEALVSTYQVDATRLVSSGAGASRPVSENDTDAGRAKNRRVELKAKS
jgi:OmpA-OmpF porin, OOP family